MGEGLPRYVVLEVVNPGCRVLEKLRELGVEEAGIADLRFTREGRVLHYVQVPEGRLSEVGGLRACDEEGRCFWSEGEGCRVCRVVLSHGAFFVRGYSRGERLVYEFIAPSFEGFKGILEELGELGVEYRVRRVERLRGGRGVLTRRQERVLWYALVLGYFDYPRRIKTGELARLLGVSPSALSETIRRGLKRLLENYFS